MNTDEIMCRIAVLIPESTACALSILDRELLASG
jgi:hypothetical protein